MEKAKCPKCGSSKTKKRFFGKKSISGSIFFTIIGLFLCYICINACLVNHEIITGSLTLFALGIVSLSVGIGKIFGKNYCCEDCGTKY